MEFLNAPEYFFARLLFERALAALYLVAFVVAFNQFPALLGEKGLLPVKRFLNKVPWQHAPSIFHLHYSDKFLKILCLLGIMVCALLILGLSGWLHPLAHMGLWLGLYFLYLSISNIGQTFYGFGWETMLCEAGFFMAFMGPEWSTPSWIPIVALRWMLFRTELGAGLIKIRGDSCWRDLSALYYHHETQPMPNPLSRHFHHLPRFVLKAGVVFSHFVQLIVPFGLFLPQPICAISGIFIILHQLVLIVAGNYSWLNWLTVTLGILAIPDLSIKNDLVVLGHWQQAVLMSMGVLTLYLSVQPFKNFFSHQQKMNYCWNRFSLVGAYGAFGSVTKKRYELIIEGSLEEGTWKEYEFKGKPGSIKRRPFQYAPYHLRLDWLMWFLPFSVIAEKNQVYVLRHEEWFLRFLQQLLQHNQTVLKLISVNPFPELPPKRVRVRYYLYRFSTKDEFRASGDYWKRELMGEYLPELSLDDFSG